MMRKLFTAICLFFSCTAFSQTNDSLVGNWQFHDVADANSLDSTKKAMLHKMFGTMKMDIRADKSYSATMFKEETGTWSFDAEKRQLVFINDKGTDRINIVALTTDQFTLELGRGRQVIMKRNATR
jgi:hypothetical protein